MAGPRLTIGLPVFNGCDYVGAAVESVLKQTYENFELIVSDNNSSDRTVEVVQQVAAGDPRVQLRSHPTNIGAHNNYNSILPLTNAEYFKWMAHDDLLAPTYLERCVEALDEHPEAVLAFSNATQIDENGEELGALTSKQAYDSPSAYARMRAYMADSTRIPQVFGVFRRSALSQSHLLPSYPKSDTVFMCEMALLGKWIVIEEPLFLNREHPERQGRLALRDRTQWYFPGRSAPLLPKWDQWGGMLSVAWTAPMPAWDKAKCLGFATYWGLRHYRELAKDLTHRASYEARRATSALGQRAE
jgi:glycosyltransferase involved in cell wall biosynthesis